MTKVRTRRPNTAVVAIALMCAVRPPTAAQPITILTRDADAVFGSAASKSLNGDRFGFSIAPKLGGHGAIPGIVIGAPGFNDDRGSVDIYQWDFVSCSWSLDQRFLGDIEGGLFGWAVASGDVNADGVDDVAISAPGQGAVLVFDGVDWSLLYRLEGDPRQRFGWSIAIGQFNGPAHGGFYADMAVGAPDGDRVYLFYGCQSDIMRCRGKQTLSAEDADVVIDTSTPGDSLGHAVSFIANRDRTDDLLIGAPRHGGAAYLIEGITLLSGPLDLVAQEDAAIEFIGDGAGFGWSVSGAVAYTIGFQDIVRIVIRNPRTATAYAFDIQPGGGRQQRLAVDQATARWVGRIDEQLGWSVAIEPYWRGDLDDDQESDVVVAAPGAGRAYIFSGAAERASWIVIGDEPVGWAVAVVPQVPRGQSCTEQRGVPLAGIAVGFMHDNAFYFRFPRRREAGRAAGHQD